MYGLINKNFPQTLEGLKFSTTVSQLKNKQNNSQAHEGLEIICFRKYFVLIGIFYIWGMKWLYLETIMYMFNSNTL
jgi:hypothetical protein